MRTLACLQHTQSEIIVGYRTTTDFTRCVNLACQYPKLGWRFRIDIHAKYALGVSKGMWIGALGSSNLVDSGQINVSSEISTPCATALARMHDTWWKQGMSLEDSRKQVMLKKVNVLKNLEEMGIPAG